MKIKYFTLILVLLTGSAFAQDEDVKTPTDDIYRFTVDQDILNLEFEGDATVHISSATGNKEDINRTPYQAYVITREEIENAGTLTIPEALRLAPGLLVRQKTNGLYEVHLLGTDNIPGQTGLFQYKSSMALVMIDNMPVNDHFTGGIFWETLPITLGDVEKIEIVAGPSSVLFGRDAANGFINIITRKPESNSLSVTANIQGGTPHTLVNNAAIGFGINDKVLVRLSGKYIDTRRFQDEYYVASENRYIPADSLLFFQSNVEETNLYGTLARQDMGINAFVQYSPNDNTDINVSISSQDSEAQSVHYSFEELTFTRRSSSSQFLNLNTRWSNLHFQASYITADQNLAVGYPGYSFEVDKINTRVFYNHSMKGLTLTPGLRYQSSMFDDSKQTSDDNAYPNIINGKKDLTYYGGFLKTNASFLEKKLTLDGGISYDLYDDQSVVSYQTAAAYTPIKKVLVRASYAKGNQGEFANNAFNESTITNADGSVIRNIINNDLDVAISKSYSLGTRINVTDKIILGVDYFHVQNSNSQIPIIAAVNNDTINSQIVNSSVILKRNGITVNLTAKISGKLKVHTFATFQSTRFDNDTTASGSGLSPKYFGGITANYRTMLDKLNIAVSLYAFGQHEMVALNGIRKIPAKLLPALKVSYKVWQENALFINVRNPIGSKSKEFIFADDIPGIYLIGAKIKF
ncbi:TonB-dependent receptor plug domain-containing protein [Fulvivirga sp. 29W222]|uniref:TonB-dependent receptor plug domain-containing protein n=1 Tax=Fulvivirga marina TaxID=2494733 RepID=A0A937KCA0_9BACT|nr:TonB-dependent receptor plug domain-containing protein [Fulvivirga marina]MBL6447154.1 TonB-dependent receptor plug domain-containing protein [Fulvivirga marina]